MGQIGRSWVFVVVIQLQPSVQEIRKKDKEREEKEEGNQEGIALFGLHQANSTPFICRHLKNKPCCTKTHYNNSLSLAKNTRKAQIRFNRMR